MPRHVIATYTGEQYRKLQWLNAEINAARLALFSADPLTREEARAWILTCATQRMAIHDAAANVGL